MSTPKESDRDAKFPVTMETGSFQHMSDIW